MAYGCNFTIIDGYRNIFYRLAFTDTSTPVMLNFAYNKPYSLNIISEF